MASGLLVLLGLALLVAGGEALVRGASGIALAGRISPVVVGLTLVAAGTSAPELVVSLQAAASGSGGLALGNVVGSNLFNTTVILGLVAVIRPLTIAGTVLRQEWPVMMLAVAQFHLLARDGALDRIEGLVLLGGLVAFTAYAVQVGRADPALGELPEEELVTASLGQVGPRAVAINVLAAVLGVLFLAGGASALVGGARGVAAGLGVSDTLVGLTLVSACTSAPELVASIVAALRGRHDLAVANVVGSNIFNVLGIAGATGALTPIALPAELVARDNLWMIGTSALLFPLMWTGLRVTRAEGAALLAVYSVYLTSLALGA